MKICWDNLNGFHLGKSGYLIRKGAAYVERDCCDTCGDNYLTVKCRQSNFCGHSCALSGENHPQFGKTFNKNWRNKLSIKARKRFSDNKNNPNYKGGVEKRKLPLYETFNIQINKYEDTSYKIYDGLRLLQVKCVYCGVWFVPTSINVRGRIAALNVDPNGRTCGEGRFYCSNKCKKACPTYRQRKYPKGFKLTTSREVQPQLRKLVFERDNYTCQKCGNTTEHVELHCHHIEGIKQNPIESADVDICITLCKICHKEVHSEKDCTPYDLKCKGGM